MSNKDTLNHNLPPFLQDNPTPSESDPNTTLSTLLESFCFLNKGRFYPLPKWMVE